LPDFVKMVSPRRGGAKKEGAKEFVTISFLLDGARV
jgi:hypothetical protein